MNAPEMVVELAAVGKYYAAAGSGGVRALDAVSFEVSAGEMVAVAARARC